MRETKERAFATKVVFKPVDTEQEKSPMLKEIIKDRGKSEEIVFLLTPEEFPKIFSPERLKLLRLFRKRPELTISEISRNLGRKREAVSRDIRFFEGLKLIELQKHARTRVPKRVVQEISIRL